MKSKIKKILITIMIVFFLTSSVNAIQTQKTTNNEKINIIKSENMDDYDPLIDNEITITIEKIRAFEKFDKIKDPDFYIKIIIDETEYKSPIWKNQKYVKPNWIVNHDIQENQEYVNIIIQLWESNIGLDKKCDLTLNEMWNKNFYDAEITYDVKTGHWFGADENVPVPPTSSDKSGYGRLNGCDDGSVYEEDHDCEIWFDITLNDYDEDGIPYWTEVNLYNTDPEVDNTGEDLDCDGIPIEWEFEYGIYYYWSRYPNIIYSPNRWEDHKNLDPDNDGLDNTEEYLTWIWESDPFRKDIFLEIDEMEVGPNGEGALTPVETYDILYNRYAKHNIVLHVDTFHEDIMPFGELIPFDDNISRNEGDLQDIYDEYFLDDGSNNWKRGVFHYGIIDYHCFEYPGFVWGSSFEGDSYRLDSFQISKDFHDTFPFENKPLITKIIRKVTNPYNSPRAVVYAGAIMHESGHTLGLFSSNVPGVDYGDFGTIIALIQWFPFRHYKSVMNYGYTYSFIDYSNGKNGKFDHDDWSNLDLTLFETDR